MRNKFYIVCLGLIVVTSASALAQQGFVPPQSGARFFERYRPESAGDTRIVGSVIDIHQVPVGYARLQLRDLSNGRVDQEGTSNENGEYEFTVLQPSTYVVEMQVDGLVVALSNAAPIARYETLRTLIQLPGRWSNRGIVRDENVATYLGVSGQLTMTSRTLEMAIEQNITPRDSGEPVSP